MKDLVDTRTALIREHELSQARRRIEMQQRAIEAMSQSLARTVEIPRFVRIVPRVRKAKGADHETLQAPHFVSDHLWSMAPVPKAGMKPPPGLACYSLANADVPTIAFSTLGLRSAELEAAVANVAKQQRLKMNFIPVFLSDSSEQDAFRLRGYAFEYFPNAQYDSLHDTFALQDKMLFTIRKWNIRSLVDLTANGHLRSRLDGTRIPELAALMTPTTVAGDLVGAVPKQSKYRTKAQRVGQRLWGGFSKPAIGLLQVLQRSSSKAEQYDAARCLARWYAYHGEHDRALDHVAFMRQINPKRSRQTNVLLLETQSLIELNRHHEARANLDVAFTSKRKVESDLRLAYANTFARDRSADSTRLGWINEAFSAGGFAHLEKRSASAPLTMGNLIAPGTKRLEMPWAPRVSVIMPAYNAAKTIQNAIGSLIDQTWPELEIIVVDDQSTDETWHIVCELAHRQSCIIPLRLERNQGAYAARNEGLSRASGDFITTHDADDWSHPQKIETQILSIMRHNDKIGCFTSRARVDDQLNFLSFWRPGSPIVQRDLSSFLLTKEAMAGLGYWDRVRAPSADAEFIHRAGARFGRDAFIDVYEEVPLSFALWDPTSLTRHSEYHISTLNFGILRDYLEAAEWWHNNNLGSDALRLAKDNDTLRKFPVPARAKIEKPEVRAYDFLFIMDYCTRGGALVSTMNYISACIKEGKKVAVFQWSNFAFYEDRPLNPIVLEAAAAGKVDIVSAGDSISADTVIIGHPPILQYRNDNPPIVAFKDLVVVVNQFAFRLRGDGDAAYSPEDARQTLREVFGTEGTWVPISNLVCRLMLEHPGYPRPHTDIWTPLIDINAHCARPLRWRGGSGKTPVVGRHSRDDYTKWPATKEDILAAYCADKPCTVRLLGGSEKAEELIGWRPPNWIVQSYDAVAVTDFLNEVDFFVHYIHKDYIEEFGRSVAEAMAAGIPAILPPVFEETFGSAALYAEPPDVWRTISKLWHNEREYVQRAAIGREFVRRNCALDLFERRMAKIIADRPTEAPLGSFLKLAQ